MIDFDELWKKAREKRKKEHQRVLRAWPAWVRLSRKRISYFPWLLLRRNLTDVGERPLPEGAAHWRSPDIWVESPHPSGKPMAGAENFLWARVINLGVATAAPTEVRFFWADPSVGLGAEDFHEIGREWVEVPPKSSVEVRCSTPWIPEFVNDGHECAMVNTSNYVLDPIAKPFKPWLDRHVGQRNLTVLPSVGGQLFSLWAPGPVMHNASAEIRMLAIRAEAVGQFGKARTHFDHVVGLAQEVLRESRARRRATGQRKARRPLAVARRIEVEDVLAGIHEGEEAWQIRTKHELGETKPPRQPSLGTLVHRMRARPGTATRLTLSFHPLKLARNEIVILEIAHVCLGFVTGGYTVILAAQDFLRDAPRG